MLTYRCPTTYREVQTSIETTKDKLARMGTLQLSVWCPYCGTSHKIAASEAQVVSERKAVTTPSGD